MRSHYTFIPEQKDMYFVRTNPEDRRACHGFAEAAARLAWAGATLPTARSGSRRERWCQAEKDTCLPPTDPIGVRSR